MEIKDILYFLTVADEGSFTRAAQKLYVTQPALSRKIAELEAELGVSLVERGSRGVRLTECGRIFHADARRLQAQYNAIVSEMASLRQGRGMSLSIAYGMAGHIAYLADALRKLRKNHPYLSVQTTRMFNAQIVQSVRTGELDAGVINLPELPEDISLLYDVLLPCGLCAFLNQDHPLFNRSSLSLAELEGERYITFERETSPREYDLLVKCCRNAGLTAPPMHAPDTSTFSLLLYTERAVGIMPYTTSIIHDLIVRRIPIHDTNGFDMVLIRRKDDNNRALDLLRACLSSVR